MYNTYTYYDPVADTTTTSTTTLQMNNVTALIILIVSLAAAILTFFLFVKMKNKPEGSFLARLHEFLNFRSIIIDGLIKFFYIFSAVSLSITSIWMMFQGFSYAPLYGLLVLVFGNLMVRVAYEFVMMLVGIWTNTTDIRRKVCERDEAKPAPKKVETKKD